ncbi:MAG: Cof-type HAD-IIB family hydrolase [Defluviitaleaceae bacterium]|nr:Cof-type HAD-IIB family hydrolase [Defluviitaleaceae bacterium]MCL2239218.1 Cof-type HAD-IIB family hydrolase [Defluviitaleaceae bacterium]
MSYQLLCTDVDGTLLNSHGKISPGNRAAIQAAVAAGKKIVLASGRSWRSLTFYEQELGLDVPGQYGIGFNGGAVYEILDSGGVKLHHALLMPNAIALEIFATLAPVVANYNEMHMLAYNNEGYLIAEAALRATRLFDEMKRLGAKTVPSYQTQTCDMYKILIHGTHEDLLEIADFSAARFPGQCQTMFSARHLLELTPMGVGKGSGIAFLAELLRIPIAQVIAMGDEANDITMLQTAGLGIAVANAVPAAVTAANLHLPASNNEDAVSAVINQYLI